ncbi:hypothetical protein KKC94_01195 [Patescibacteria group bacterium]|nr:hypothetical protein [Patescibacteria group bacterium]
MSKSLPKMNMDLSETGCCPQFNPDGWDDEKFILENKKFIKMCTKNFLHVPLNMGKAMTSAWEKVQKVNAAPKDHYLLLSYDPSPWRGEHFMEVTKDVPGLKNTRLSGTFLTKVFEGPYKNARLWVKEMQDLVQKKDKKMKKLYFFYTTCPKCARHYNKNYVVGFAEI